LKPETLCDTQEENVEILEGHYTVGEWTYWRRLKGYSHEKVCEIISLNQRLDPN
jgi:hypothetical protein